MVFSFATPVDEIQAVIIKRSFGLNLELIQVKKHLQIFTKPNQTFIYFVERRIFSKNYNIIKAFCITFLVIL